VACFRVLNVCEERFAKNRAVVLFFLPALEIRGKKSVESGADFLPMVSKTSNRLRAPPNLCVHDFDPHVAEDFLPLESCNPR
jgi:hypothetical protein